jgi:hypothetical protein
MKLFGTVFMDKTSNRYRIFFLIFIAIGFLSNANVQFTPKTKGFSSFARFNNTETYFVLSGREELLDALTKDSDKSFVYIHKIKIERTEEKIEALALEEFLIIKDY